MFFFISEWPTPAAEIASNSKKSVNFPFFKTQTIKQDKPMFKSEMNICLQDAHLFVPSPEPFMLSGSLSKDKFQYLPIFTNIYDIYIDKTRYASTNHPLS